MISLSLNIQLSNILNLLLGVVLGFFFMVILACAIFSKTLKKRNKSEKIREISKRAYTENFLAKSSVKDKIIHSIYYEIKEVSTLCYPDKQHPVYEISINDLFFAITHIQNKLKKLISNPLFKDIKNIHITTLVNFEDKIYKPVRKVNNNKFVQGLKFAWKIIFSFINLVNPVYYMRIILNYFLSKRGKKDLFIIALDFIGNTTYEIYNREKDLQKSNSNL